MVVRRVLRSNPSGKDTFSEIWFEIPDEKRRTIKNLNDYLLIDDLYTELRKRNQYLSDGEPQSESDLSKSNTFVKINETILSAAENASVNLNPLLQ